MGKCKDCRYCQSVSNEIILNIYKTTYYCTNEAVVQAKGQGKYSHDVRVGENDSCKLFDTRPSMSDIGFRKG